MLRGTTFFAGADLALLDAGGAEDVVRRFLELFAGDEFAFAVVTRARNAKPNAIAAIGKRSIATDLFIGEREVSGGRAWRVARPFQTACVEEAEVAGHAGFGRIPFLSDR